MPLVQGASHIKWHLPHSIHSEHRGRTPKCPIANHRVEYTYAKVIPVRLAIDKSNALTECPIEFEVLQEFSSGGPAAAALHTATTARSDERITLGRLTLNLAEYVEESEAILRDTGYRVRAASAATAAVTQGHTRKRSSLSTTAPLVASEDAPAKDSNGNINNKPPSITETPATPVPDAPASAAAPVQQVEDGVIRRYLMADSKINSTLKIGVLMIQQDGERNFVAPALKTAPVFGGIAGMTNNSSSSTHPAAGDFGMHFQDAHTDHAEFTLDNNNNNNSSSNAAGVSLTKSRDAYESQDVYRRALAASWASQPGELAADECIEDIFGGGDGFGPDAAEEEDLFGGDTTPRGHHYRHSRHHHHHHQHHGGVEGESPTSGGRSMVRREDSISSAGEGGFRVVRAAGARAKRHGSGETLRQDSAGFQHRGGHHQGHKRDGSKDSGSSSLRGGMMGMRSRSGSLVSLTGTIESERGRSGFKNSREVTEREVREDMVAWALPGAAS